MPIKKDNMRQKKKHAYEGYKKEILTHLCAKLGLEILNSNVPISVGQLKHN